MKNIINLFIFILLLGFSTISIASAQKKPKEPACPAANAFKNIEFDTVEEGDHPGVWTLTQSDQTYKTNRHWKFSVMIDTNSNNKEIALKKGKEVLSNLRKIRGPEKVDNVWVCDYESKDAMSAIAISDEQSKK